jgi:hypothetical protein
VASDPEGCVAGFRDIGRSSVFQARKPPSSTAARSKPTHRNIHHTRAAQAERWAIHPDGDRFLMLRFEEQESPDGIRIVVNWDKEVESLFSADD